MVRDLVARLALGAVALRRPRFLALPGLVLGVGLSGTAIAQTNVTFLDSNLEAAVRSALSIPVGALTSADLQGLTCLSACKRQITNLSGLEAATNLTGLYLNGNAIGDLTPLGGLSQLRSLELKKNGITDLSPLGRIDEFELSGSGGQLSGRLLNAVQPDEPEQPLGE